MKRIQKWGTCLIAITLVLAFAFTEKASAAQDLLPYASNNLNSYLIKSSSLVATSNGYVRVFRADDKIYVEDYNNSFQLTGRRTIPSELSYYGGFFSGSDAYYLVFGQSNTAEDNAVEVIRVVKYSKNWTRLGATALHGDDRFGCQIRYPFHYGNVSMAEQGGKLYLVTGHEGYVDPAYHQGHQGFLMFVIDEATMTGRLTDADLWHSFSQHIAIKDADHIYVLEESEGSRFTKLSKLNGDGERNESIATLQYGGDRTSAWAVPTHATADAVAVSADHVLAVGSSIDQSKYQDQACNNIYNVYLTVTPMDSFTQEATKFVWITKYHTEAGIRDIKLTKINDDRFMLSWETESGDKSVAASDEYDTLSKHVLHYLYLNGKGEVASREYTAPAALSDCEPVVNSNQVVYYASDGGSLSFYSVDASSGAFQKKKYQLAGEQAQWDFSGGVLTISGRGRIFDHFSENSLSLIRSNVKRIVIGKGITEIGDNAFTGFDNLTQIVIPKGIQKIGSNAFAYNQSLMELNLPRSVTSIGDNILHTGYYWIGSGDPVVYATITCEKGSQAEKYAIKNQIEYTITSVKLKNKTSSYTGKPIQIAKAEVTGRTGKVEYRYYTDAACTKLTAKGNGAAASGGAPSRTGVYYVRATIQADDVFDNTVSNTAKLEIRNTGAKAKKLSAPIITKVENVNGGVKISWKKVSGAAKYRVFYQTGSGKWKTLGNTGATSYTWKKAKSGTKYKFTVRCVNKKGEYVSDYNKTGKSIRYIAVPKLTRVQNTKAGVRVTWKKSPGAAKYRVFRKTGKGKWVKLGDTTKLTFVDKKAKKGVKYAYTVRCVSSNGKKYASGYNTKGINIQRK